MFSKCLIAAVCVFVSLLQAGEAVGRAQSILGIPSVLIDNVINLVGVDGQDLSLDPRTQTSKLTAKAGISPLAKTPLNVANTDWTLAAKAKVSVQRYGSMLAQGLLYVSFSDDGSMSVEDDDGYSFEGAYGYDQTGKLWVHIDESTIEQFVYDNLPSGLENYGLVIDVQSSKSNVQAKSGKNGAIMNLSLSFAAVISFDNPNTGKRQSLKMKYSAKGKGPQD